MKKSVIITGPNLQFYLAIINIDQFFLSFWILKIEIKDSKDNIYTERYLPNRINLFSPYTVLVLFERLFKKRKERKIVTTSFSRHFSVTKNYYYYF